MQDDYTLSDHIDNLHLQHEGNTQDSQAWMQQANENFAKGNYHIYVSRFDRRTVSSKAVLNSIGRHLKHIVKIAWYSQPWFDRRKGR